MPNVLVVGGSAVVQRMSRVLGVLGLRRMQTRSTRMAVVLARELPFHAVVLELGAVSGAVEGVIEALRQLQPDALVVGVGDAVDPSGLDVVLPLGAPIRSWGRVLGVAFGPSTRLNRHRPQPT